MKRLISITIVLLIMLMFSITANAIEANNVQVVTNGNTTFLIESNGNVKGWGRNTSGEVGNGTKNDQNMPDVIEGLSNIREIISNETGYGYFFAIDHCGQVYAWGNNRYGQLGLGHTLSQTTPARIDGLPKVSQVILDEYTAYAITTNGDVYAWGRNQCGQVGNGTKANQSRPYLIEQLPDVKAIVCEAGVTFAVATNGDVYAWGRGDDFQMGNGEYIFAQTTPVKITALSNVNYVVTNGRASFAICDNRQEVYSWGSCALKELGTYSERNRTPRRVWTLSDLDETIEMIMIDGGTCFAITGDNTLYGWGYNFYNQLGNGGTYELGVPKPIKNIPKVKQFVFTGMTGIALGIDNCVYAWGRNSYGEAGTGDQSRIRHPAKLRVIGSNIEKISGGHNTVYAIDMDGSVYGWGSNYKGQIGCGSTSTIAEPTLVIDLSNMAEIENTNRTVYALSSDGVVYGWGKNDYNQIDSEEIDNVLTPYMIVSNQMTTTTGTGDVNSTVPVVGSINALEISITHPANIFYSIDPNTEDGFYCADIKIHNISKVPVKVHVESFESNNNGGLVFQDVLPDSMDWSNLNRQETKNYIALGLQYVDETEWLISQSDLVEPLYAVEVDNTFIGALAKGSSAALSLCGYHGLAFEGSYSAKHELVFVVSLL